MARRAAKAAKGSRQTGLFLSLLNRACSTTAEARQSEQRQTQLRIDYDRYRRTEAERLFDKLPAGEQGEIEALARAKLSAGGAKYQPPLQRIQGRRQREPGCDQQRRCCDVAMGDSRWPKI
jgi:hypothetical protein